MVHLYSLVFLNETSSSDSTCPCCGFAEETAVGWGEVA